MGTCGKAFADEGARPLHPVKREGAGEERERGLGGGLGGEEREVCA